jgi:predicted AlkP superfamily pyrophosphatase or phosphodiesterase
MLCVLNVVGLTPALLPHAPRLAALAAEGQCRPWRSPFPAVTLTSQATMLTGEMPSRHGAVANGWLFRDTQEVRFWQQTFSLLKSDVFYRRYKAASIFWWFSLGAPFAQYAVPRPFYGADGSKAFGVLDRTGCDLERTLGPFPFANFWGPGAGLPSSRWLADAAAKVLRRQKPEITLVYLPHLDYDLQRNGPDHPATLERVKEIDACAATVLDAAQECGARPIVVSEYGLVPVKRPVLINRELRKRDWISVRGGGPYGEVLEPYASKVLAVCDHQLAHIYVKDLPLAEVRAELEKIPGVARVVEPRELQLDHPRSGELIALSSDDTWFAYPFWLDDRVAPDYARTVAIHAKPGYDPAELFMTSRSRAATRLMQKKLGFRYLMDIVPLDPALVKGSHGLQPSPEHGPLIIGPKGAVDAPESMTGFPAYIHALMEQR